MVTLDRVQRLVATSRPRGGLRGSRLILLGLSILLGAMLADASLLGLRPPMSWLLPQLVLLAIVLVFVHGISQNRRASRLMLEAFEAAQLRRWDQAEPLLQQLLSAPVRHAQARGELLLALAAVADAQQEYDSAQRICEEMLQENQADPLQLHTARVALAAAMLRTGQLTDAVRLIDRLARSDLPEALKAQVELVALLREVVMGQAQDSVAVAEARRRLFRDHLGTRAAYGYGLLAAAFDRAHQPDTAARYWHDATLLVRPAELIERFRELEPLVAKYPQAEVAI